MKKSAIAASILLSFLVATSASADPKTPGTHQGYSTISMLKSGIPSELNMVSVAELAKELGAKGIEVERRLIVLNPIKALGTFDVARHW